MIILVNEGSAKCVRRSWPVPCRIGACRDRQDYVVRQRISCKRFSRSVAAPASVPRRLSTIPRKAAPFQSTGITPTLS